MKSLCQRLRGGSLGTQDVDGVLEIARIFGREDHRFAAPRVPEPKPNRVKPLSLETEPGRNGRICAVHRVTDAGMPLRGHVNADLMGSPRLELHLQERRA